MSYNVPMKIVYLHGWRSAHSEESKKFQFLKSLCEELGHELATPSVPYERFCSPTYKGVSASNWLTPICKDAGVIMGTSLGGYMALWQASLHSKACVLINPAKQSDVENMIDRESGKEVENYVTGEKHFIDSLSARIFLSNPVDILSMLWARAVPGLVLIGQNDEVIEPKKSALVFSLFCDVQTYPGVDHRFENLEIARPQIVKFLNNMIL